MFGNLHDIYLLLYFQYHYKKILRELKDEQLQKQTVAIYDIYALHSSEHIEELVHDLEDLEMSQRGYLEMLISDSYKNADDLKNAKKYKKLSLMHFKQLEQEIKQKKNVE